MGEEIIRHKVTFSGGEPTSAKNFARIALSVFFLFSFFFWGGCWIVLGFSCLFYSYCRLRLTE